MQNEQPGEYSILHTFEVGKRVAARVRGIRILLCRLHLNLLSLPPVPTRKGSHVALRTASL